MAGMWMVIKGGKTGSKKAGTVTVMREEITVTWGRVGAVGTETVGLSVVKGVSNQTWGSPVCGEQRRKSPGTMGFPDLHSLNARDGKGVLGLNLFWSPGLR